MITQPFLRETTLSGFANAGVPDAGLVARVYIAGPTGLYHLTDLNVNSFLTTTMVSAVSSLALLYAARWLKDVDLAASPWLKMIYNPYEMQHGMANVTATTQCGWIANPAREIPTGRAFVPGLLDQVSPDPTSQCSNGSDIALKTLEPVYYRRTGKRVSLNTLGITLSRVPRFVCSDTGRTLATTVDHAGVPLNIPLEGDEILQDCILEQKISPFTAFTLEPKICPASYASVHFVCPSAWSGPRGFWGYSIAAPATGFRTLGPATAGIFPSDTNSVFSNTAFLQHPFSFYPGVCLNIPLRSQFFVDSTLVEDDQFVECKGNSLCNLVQNPKDGPMSTDGVLVRTTQVIGKLTAFSNYLGTLDMSRFLQILGYGPRFCQLVSHYLLDGIDFVPEFHSTVVDADGYKMSYIADMQELDQDGLDHIFIGQFILAVNLAMFAIVLVGR